MDGLSNAEFNFSLTRALQNSYPGPNQASCSYLLSAVLKLFANERLGLSRDNFFINLRLKILQASILATCSAYLYLLNLITLTILDGR
jgi:hypothetical protein